MNYDDHHWHAAGMDYEDEDRLPRIVGWGLALLIGLGCWAIVYYGIKFFWF